MRHTQYVVLPCLPHPHTHSTAAATTATTELTGSCIAAEWRGHWPQVWSLIATIALLVACCVCGPRMLRKLELLQPLLPKRGASDCKENNPPEGYQAAAP